MKYKHNWDETKERFEKWWKGTNTGRPLMYIVARKKEPCGVLYEDVDFKSPEEYHLNIEKRIRAYSNYCKTHSFMAEAFPWFSAELGPGSMATYLGSEPEFDWNTVWFKECIHDIEGWGNVRYDPQNPWLQKHMDMIRKSMELGGEEFHISIPDIVENIDILAAMRGPQNLIFDMMDEPEIIKRQVKYLDDLYFKYYDPMFELLKDQDGGSSYTRFKIWGSGKIAKVQCDFSALISPDQFREFVLPSLKEQCRGLDNSLYHLDGPDAIKHVDALMEICDLDALQWTCGAGKPDGGNESWYVIYDKVRAAGKSLWIQLYDGDVNDWANSTERLVKRYGTDGLYLIFPEMDEEEACQLLKKAEKNWK